MSTTRKVYRAAYHVDRARRAVQHPARYARNRVTFRALAPLLRALFWRP